MPRCSIRIKNAEEVNTGEGDFSALGVKAIDPKTLSEITLKAPTPYFQPLTHQTGLPVNEKAVTTLGDEWVKPGRWAPQWRLQAR